MGTFTGVFAGLVLLGMPVAFVLAVTGSVYMMISGCPWKTMIMQSMISTVDSFVFVCIPFFLLVGELMSKARITDELILLSTYIVGGIRGSLAYVNILVSMMFAGISGSGAAEASALGSIMIPGMTTQKYEVDDACAITAMASAMGPIIPPSIPMVVLGLVTGLSIGKLLLSGAIPGMIFGFALMSVAYLHRSNFPPARVGRPSFSEVLRVFIRAVPAMVTPVVIVGGIVSGAVTPTEASAVAVLWSLICGFFIYRTLKLSDLPEIFLRISVMTGAILILVSASGVLAWGFTVEDIPGRMGAFMASISPNKYWLIFNIIILLLILGTFMDPTVIIIVMSPILLPVALKAGMDPIHFGCTLVIGSVIGLCTPPLGVCLFIVSIIGNISLDRVVRAILPYLFAAILVCFLVAYVPILATWLPNLLIR